MGTIEEGKITKKRILSESLKLFRNNGYDKTSIQQILDNTGIGKGTFYHHFSSKEEILDSIIDDHLMIFINLVRSIAQDPSLSAINKINTLMLKIQNLRNNSTEKRISLIQMMAKEANLKLTYKYTEKIVSKTCDIYTSIIQQGIEENSFNTPYPAQTAETIIRMALHFRAKTAIKILSQSNNDSLKKNLKQTGNYLEEMIARLLGIPKDCLKIAETLARANPKGGV